MVSLCTPLVDQTEPARSMKAVPSTRHAVLAVPLTNRHDEGDKGEPGWGNHSALVRFVYSETFVYSVGQELTSLMPQESAKSLISNYIGAAIGIGLLLIGVYLTVIGERTQTQSESFDSLLVGPGVVMMIIGTPLLVGSIISGISKRRRGY
jgi:hypothetical protein